MLRRTLGQNNPGRLSEAELPVTSNHACRTTLAGFPATTAWGNIADHDRSRGNDGIFSHRHSRKDERTGTDPDVVVKGNRIASLQPLPPQCRLARMIGCQELDVET